MSADLISGRLGGDRFPAQVLGRTYRRYAANAAQTTDFAHLLTWPDLNQLLATRRLDVPRMRLSDGQTVDVGQYTRLQTYRRMPNWNAPVPHLFHEQLREGATLVVDAIDEMHPPINTVAAELEAWLGTRVQVNAYASWTAKEGFGVHWDDHDVIVLQVSGRKRWRIYGTTRQAPLYSDVEVDNDAPTESIDEFTMEPGDVLHVPRGCWHAASASEGEPSLHLTCGLNTTTGADFLDWISGLMREHVEIRSDVPRDKADQAAWTYRLAELITQRLQSPGLVEEYWDQNKTALSRDRARGEAQQEAGAQTAADHRDQMVQILRRTHWLQTERLRWLFSLMERGSVWNRFELTLKLGQRPPAGAGVPDTGSYSCAAGGFI